MDHTRHLSSPSPTSSFLFHHPERNYKSNPLNPLLSSTADVTSVDDCFSGATSVASSSTNNSSFDSNHHHHHHHHHHHQHHHDPLSGHGHHGQHQDQCVIDHDSLTGVDDDDGMHNMLSGSSTSSTSTMPLLTESHSHHSFSRISLEEYSPLSLVEDCDNALNTISPTSLACGSHHSFKSSLNGLAKIDNLVDVGVDDVVVGDARSMSPNLLSASTSGNHNTNLWSNSSTAITQNSTLMTSSSTSFLLSQHHHHQFNSLMQQLEPQSLDESPPILSNNGISSLESELTTTHRPSSEPPPDIGFELSADIDNKKSSQCQTTVQIITNRTNGNTIDKMNKSGASNVSGLLNSSSNRSSSRRSRTKSGGGAKNQSQPIDNKRADLSNQDKQSDVKLTTPEEPVHSSKVHLQLNHQEKLKELQQRLFGVTAELTVDLNKQESLVSGDLMGESRHNFMEPESKFNPQDSKEEADSSANKSCRSGGPTKGVSVETVQRQQLASMMSPVKGRSRPSRSRRSRSVKNHNCSSLSGASGGNGVAGNNNTNSNATTTNSGKNQRIVTTETAEPDTTTKTSDCVKLADLLSTNTNNSDSKTNHVGIMLNNASMSQTLDSANGLFVENNEKRIQQIQLQVSPALTVVANGGLIQPFNIQQAQLANGTPITSNSFTGQILCRPQTVVASNANCGGGGGNQAKNNQTLSNGELHKATNDGAILSNWSLQATPANVNQGNNNTGTSNNSNSSFANGTNGLSNNSNNNNGTTLTSNSATIGTHQIAIQVICQDGTSLVLPVSSAAGLNAAVSLTSQHHQQLQSVLAGNINGINGNNSNNQSRNQVLPFVSVANIVAQQQQQQQQQQQSGSLNDNSSAAAKSIILTNSNQNSSSLISSQNSGLAASTPTLAALLDAGSSNKNIYLEQSSSNNDLTNNNNHGNSTGHNFISGNLLRKLVSGSSSKELKRGNGQQVNGPTHINLTGKSSLVALCAANNQNSQIASKSINVLDSGNGEKRIKLENIEAGSNSNNNNIQATLTLIDPQGLIVAHGNEKLLGKQALTNQAKNSTSSHSNATASSLQQQQQQTNLVTNKTANENPADNSETNKQNKMSSSTGNRQVDPAQPFRCEHCNSTFTRLGNFTRHKKIHTVPTKDGQRFKCEVCSKSFLQRCDLARHLHIHRGTEPHRCNICGKGYIRHSDLVTHQRFHNKEKPFGCPHCSKGFCQRGDLNRHLRSIHLQMKPILCPCCNRKFAKQETLLRHLNTAHRSKPGATSTTTVIAELPSSHTLSQDNDNQASVSLIDTNSSNNAASQKNNAPVVSLQAIQATLNKVQQSVDSTQPAGGVKVVAAVEEKKAAKIVS